MDRLAALRYRASEPRHSSEFRSLKGLRLPIWQAEADFIGRSRSGSGEWKIPADTFRIFLSTAPSRGYACREIHAVSRAFVAQTLVTSIGFCERQPTRDQHGNAGSEDRLHCRMDEAILEIWLGSPQPMLKSRGKIYKRAAEGSDRRRGNTTPCQIKGSPRRGTSRRSHP